MTGKLNGKVVVITGAARGMGRAAAKACAEVGGRVCALDVLGDEVEALAGPNLMHRQMDLTNADDVIATFERTKPARDCRFHST